MYSTQVVNGKPRLEIEPIQYEVQDDLRFLHSRLHNLVTWQRECKTAFSAVLWRLHGEIVQKVSMSFRAKL